jgi:hypothetical protein
MQRTQVLEFTAMLSLGPPARDSTAEWLKFPCPFAPFKHANGRDRKPSFGIRCSEDDDSAFHCFACHEKGPLVRLPIDLGHLRGGDFGPYQAISQQIKQTEFIKKTIVRPWIEEPEIYEASSQDKLVWPDPAREFEYYSAAGHPYLRERGISWATAIALGLRFDPYQRRILFPVKDRAGRFAGFTGRAIDRPYRETDDGPIDRAGNPFLKVRDYFGLRKRDFLLGEDRCRARTGIYVADNKRPSRTGRGATRVVLVEGLFDYAYLTELGVRNVLALMGSALTPVKAEKLMAYDGVILFLDNDAAGYQAQADITAQLFKKVPLVEVKYPDGFDGADPASLPPRVVREMLENRRQILSLAA